MANSVIQSFDDLLFHFHFITLMLRWRFVHDCWTDVGLAPIQVLRHATAGTCSRARSPLKISCSVVIAEEISIEHTRQGIYIDRG